jgi:paraquat-inducible protein B
MQRLERWASAVLLLLMLAGCGDRNLHLKLHYRSAEGLAAGAPVVFENRPIGSVEAVEPDPAGGYLVRIALSNKFAAAATADSRFYLAEQQAEPGKKRIEIEQTRPGGPVLAEGSRVEGSERSGSLIPFGDIFRQVGESLRGMREQVEQFQKDLQKFQGSEEAKRLQEEWRRLTDEVQKAQSQTEESVKKDLLPKLQEEMNRLREQFQRLEPKGQGTGQR